MWRHKKYALKMILFLILMSCWLSAVNRVLIPKYFYNGDWPATSTCMDFYRMERNSIDVIFLGSSHCAAAFSPIELYERYGIRSYNLGCEQQNLLLSYYWLKEALRFQKPKYVFLDTFMLFPYDRNAPLNTSEPTTRKAVDFMKWSAVKAEAVYDICRIDGSQNLSSYLFPNERFHTRWKSLSEDDFSAASMGRHETLMGFFPIHFVCHDDSYQPFGETGQAEYAEMVPVMEEYLDKIVALCAEEGIGLALTKTPTMFYPQEAYHTVSAYAGENGLEYLDFNEETLYAAAGLDFSQDSCDTDHVNITGAIKVSDYIGEWLEGKVTGGWEDAQWEERARYYEHYLKDEELKYVTDLHRYLQLVLNEDYSVFLAGMGRTSEVFGAAAEELGALGLDMGLAEDYESSYYAVIDGNKVVAEAMGREALRGQGTTRRGLLRYGIMSAGADGGSDCSITLNGGEFALKQPGLNVVVYCNDKKRLIDRVCFFLEDGEIRCVR